MKIRTCLSPVCILTICFILCLSVLGQTNTNELIGKIQTAETGARKKAKIGKIKPNRVDTILNKSNIASSRTGPTVATVSAITIEGGNNGAQIAIPGVIQRPANLVVEFDGDAPVTGYCHFSVPPDGQQHGAPTGECNDKVSTVIIPIGMSAKICEHDGGGSDGYGRCQNYGAGTSYVGNEMNDKGSSFWAYDQGSYFYLTTDNNEVPSALDVGVSWTATSDGTNGKFSVSLNVTRDWYVKNYSIPLPNWCANPDVFESTKANEAEWKSTVTNGVLNIEMKVKRKLPLSSNNWVGVGVRCKA